LLVAVVVGLTGVLGNAGAGHPLPENFAVFGYHVTGSKKYFGRATGNTRLRTEGRVEQAMGNTKQVGDKAKGIFKR
jgi:hypothetical protein